MLIVTLGIAPKEITLAIFNLNRNDFDSTQGLNLEPFGQLRHIHRRIVRVPLDGAKGKLRRAGMAHTTDDTAMTAGGDITARPRIALLHIPRGEDLLVENRYGADEVAAAFVRPDSRSDIVDRIDDIAIAVVAHRAMGALGGIPNDWHRSVDQQIEPIGCFFDKGAAFQPDRAE